MITVSGKESHTMDWIDKLDRKFGRHSIPHLMYFVTGIMLAVFAADLVLGGKVTGMLYFDRDLILQGQVWRLITFAFLPPDSSLIWIFFSLYFYCIIGNGLEQAWGSFRFNIFYLVGVLGTILSGFLTGYAINYYLNMSLFLAFAAIYPEHEVLMFFFLPIKIKWLALLDALYFIVSFVMGSWSARLAILFALLNILLFFGGDFLRNVKQQAGYWKTRQNFRRNNRR